MMKRAFRFSEPVGATFLFTGALIVCFEILGFAQGEVNTPPGIVLTNPPSECYFVYPALIRLKASAADVDGAVVRVDFFETTNYLGSVAQPPYHLIVTNEGDVFRDPPYCYYAVATDDRGSTATSAPVKLIVGQAPASPELSMTQPADGESFLLSASITNVAIVIAHDGSENPVHFFSGTNLVGTALVPIHSIPVTNPPSPRRPYVATYYRLTLTNLAAGPHDLTAQYVDNIGNSATAPPVRITVTPLYLTGPRLATNQLHFVIGRLSIGKVFQVEVSSNLISWSAILTNIAVSNSFPFIEPATNRSQRFYRAAQEL